MRHAEPSLPSPPVLYRFGLFEADPASGTLMRAGVRVKIQDQPLRVLIALLEQPREIVSREDLRRILWPAGTFVDFDGSLNVIVKKLRAAIGDDPGNPRFIETIPGKGYRFIAPVAVEEAGAPSSPPAIAGRAAAPVQLALKDEPEHTASAAAPGMPGRYRWLRLTGFTATLAILALIAVHFRKASTEGKTPPRDPAAVNSIAVMPFSNWGAGPSLDYLRYALASDIITDLTYARSLSVRPLASTSKYGDHPEDPQAEGREMKASYVISGYFANDGGQLAVTAEMSRVADDRVLWRETLSAAPTDLVRLHDDLAWSLQKGVIGVLGTGQMTGNIPVPHSQHAYDLYLRSVAVPRDPAPNKEAILDLAESVKEDPAYGPAWIELAWRYYIDASYADGGEQAYKSSEDASAHAAQLDPLGTANWITLRTERGDLQGAWNLARNLLALRPDSWDSHFEMSYVYRYAGLLDKAAMECNAGMAADPGNPILRSCSKVFMYRGDYGRAGVFVDLDGSSGWSVRQRMQFALRQKNYTEALALARLATDTGYHDADIVRARLEIQPPAVLDRTGARAVADAEKQSDSEEEYEVGAMLSFAGQSDRALHVLGDAIRRGYCAVPMLQSDPLLGGLRGRPPFRELENQASACQQNFLTYVTAASLATPSPRK